MLATPTNITFHCISALLIFRYIVILCTSQKENLLKLNYCTLLIVIGILAVDVRCILELIKYSISLRW
jgi:hypothetical protein